MDRETPAQVALDLAEHLKKVEDRIHRCEAPLKDRPFKIALYVVAVITNAAIMRGKLLEFADHCCEFATSQAQGEPAFPTFDLKEPPI